MTEPSSQPTRRDFVKTTTATTAAALAASGLGARAYAAGGDEIKIALIGAGGRGTGACEQALSTSGPIKLVAIADAFEDQLHNSLAILNKGHADRIDVPDERKFVGFDAYKKAIDCGVDGVLLTTPPGFRPMHFEYAVERGKHVFMEKPLATDVPGVRRILAANEIAKQKNLKVTVGLQRHYDVQYQETIKRIHGGEIGEVLGMRCYWDGGPLWVKPRQPGQSELEYQMRNWYYFTWIGGDHIVEQHIHNIDVCNWVMGGPPAFAQSHGGRQVRTGKEYGEIYDHHAVEFVYGDRWDTGTHMFSFCRQIEGTYSAVSEYAIGTKGSAILSGATLYDLKGERIWRYDHRRDEKLPKPGNPYQVEHDVQWDAVRNNITHNDVESGAQSTLTAILGRSASYSGKLLRMSQVEESKVSIMPTEWAWNAKPPLAPNADGYYPVPMPGTWNNI